MWPAPGSFHKHLEVLSLVDATSIYHLSMNDFKCPKTCGKTLHTHTQKTIVLPQIYLALPLHLNGRYSSAWLSPLCLQNNPLVSWQLQLFNLAWRPPIDNPTNIFTWTHETELSLAALSGKDISSALKLSISLKSIKTINSVNNPKKVIRLGMGPPQSPTH